MQNTSMKECPIRREKCVGFSCAWWSSPASGCVMVNMEELVENTIETNGRLGEIEDNFTTVIAELQTIKADIDNLHTHLSMNRKGTKDV
jgi:hypothetical protein